VYFQSGDNCGGGTMAFIDIRQATVGSPASEWKTIENPAVTGTAGLPSAFFEVHAAKADQSAVPLDIEIDMPYLAPSPHKGWR
jgi:hypothetical protein